MPHSYYQPPSTDTFVKNGTAVTFGDGTTLTLPANGSVLPANKLTVTDYSAAGPTAATIGPGVAAMNRAGVVALTLANPAAADEGTVMIFTAETAHAHTVTCTGGFAGGGSGADVATFGGAIGDNMVVLAHNLLWHVLSLRNVTLG